jgi:hypothetical protein
MIVNTAGSAYLVFGYPELAGQIDLTNIGSKGIKISGIDSSGLVNLNNLTSSLINTGRSGQEEVLSSTSYKTYFATYEYGLTGIGDINGDGWDDMAVNTANNQVKVIFGRNNWSDIDLANFVTSSSNGFTVDASSLATHNPIGADDALISNLTIQGVGDVNGDGYQDFALGNPFAASGYGKVSLVFGSAQATHLNLASLGNRGVNFLSDGTNKTNIGADIAGVGDINSDGFDDIVLGGPTVDGILINGVTDRSGASFVVFG